MSQNDQGAPCCVVSPYFFATVPAMEYFFSSLFFWCPCMAINVSVQYNGGLLPDIILLTQCYYHRAARLNATKRFCIYNLL